MTDELKQWEFDRGYAKGKADALEKIRAEVEQEITYKPIEMWDYRMGLTKALDIIDKYRKSEDKE